MSDARNLIMNWQKCDFDLPPYVFQGDEEILSQIKKSEIFHSHNEFINNPDYGVKNADLHLGILPTPYSGNLSNADIFILMLNPGLSYGDYFGEYNNEDFRKGLIRGIKQENEYDEFPFIFLNPEFSWNQGYIYWVNKLEQIIRRIQEDQHITFQQASRCLSKRIAVLQLLPYHSDHFKAHKFLDLLPSVNCIVKYAHELLQSKIDEDKAAIIVTRQQEKWGFIEQENIIVYNATETRHAYMGENSRGGKLILKRLGIQ